MPSSLNELLDQVGPALAHAAKAARDALAGNLVDRADHEAQGERIAAVERAVAEAIADPAQSDDTRRLAQVIVDALAVTPPAPEPA